MISPLRFRRVVVRRMPGFPDGGLELHDLSPGVNIIYGPNAAGKTTLARALEGLLWPAAALERSALSGEFELVGSWWRIDLDAGYTAYQRDGRDAAAPPLPSAEARHRYRLSLHELIVAEDEAFAEAVRRESAGGYDVAAAARVLGFREPSPAHLARSERKALEAAEARLRKARRRQDELREKERGLEEIRRRLSAAEEAARRAILLRRCLEYLEAQDRVRSAREELATFPERMKDLRGGEADDLRTLAERLAEARRTRDRAERDAEEARRRLASARLPEGGLPGEVLPALRRRVEALREAARSVEAADATRQAAAEQRDQARRDMGSFASDDLLARVDADGLEEMAAFARRAEHLRAEAAAIAAELRWLGPAADGLDPEAPARGADLLRAWLAANRSGAGAGRELRRWAMAALVVCGALLVAGALAVHPAIVLGLVVPAMLAYRVLRLPAGDDPRPTLRAQYEAQPLEPPQVWDAKGVAELARHLERKAAEARLEQERALRRGEAEQRRAAIERARAELDRERDGLVERFGTAPDVDEATLYWLAQRIVRWREAEALEKRAAAEAAAARARLAETLASLRSELERFGYSGIEDASGAAGAVDDLERRRQEHEKAAASLAGALDRVVLADREIEKHAGDRAALFERLGLEEGGDATVAEWCRRHDAFGEAQARARDAERELERAHRALLAIEGFDPLLLDRGSERLATELLEAESEAAQRDGLIKQAAEIGKELEIASHGHDVEDALAEVERCRDALAQARDRDLAAAVGKVLADAIQQATRDHARPAVFRRARKLFELFSRGRFTLDIQDTAAPAFMAIDNTSRTGHELSALSSGTRVQLLLAVRIAFVETLEQGAALPLVLDEVLGNSDDARARAIMEATAASAREGRQVFYFTAQADEVAKWTTLLAGAEVPYRVIDLARERGLDEEVELPPLERIEPAAPAVPPPGGMSHTEYGRVLGVPPLDPRTDPVQRAHLWYLIDDCEALHRVLSLGIETWGQFEALTGDGGAGWRERLGVDPARVRAAARALGEALDLARVGRGRPVDRQALLDSGAVSETFIDRVADLCGELNGDAAALLDSLGTVPRFRSDKAEVLREFLTERGYLDPRPPLAPEEARARLLRTFAEDLRAGRMDLQVLERSLAIAGMRGEEE